MCKVAPRAEVSDKEALRALLLLLLGFTIYSNFQEASAPAEKPQQEACAIIVAVPERTNNSCNNLALNLLQAPSGELEAAVADAAAQQLAQPQVEAVADAAAQQLAQPQVEAVADAAAQQLAQPQAEAEAGASSLACSVSDVRIRSGGARSC